MNKRDLNLNSKWSAVVVSIILLACSESGHIGKTGIEAALVNGRPGALLNGNYFSDGDGTGCGAGTDSVSVYDNQVLYLPNCNTELAMPLEWDQLNIHPAQPEIFTVNGSSQVFEWSAWDRPGEEKRDSRTVVLCEFGRPLGDRSGDSEFTRLQVNVLKRTTRDGDQFEMTLAHEMKNFRTNITTSHLTLPDRIDGKFLGETESSLWTHEFGKVLRVSKSELGNWQASLVWELPGSEDGRLVFKDGRCQWLL